jgi:hypothetical protein
LQKLGLIHIVRANDLRSITVVHVIGSIAPGPVEIIGKSLLCPNIALWIYVGYQKV